MTTSCGSQACREYLELSRRRFLQTSGVAAMAMATAPAWLPRVARARDHRGAQRDALVSIFLRGGADGLTLCVPFAEQRYYDLRPTIAVPRPDSGDPNACTDLNGFFGLPQAMAPLRPAYQDGKMLIVHATGLIDGTRSHFDAQRFMEVGKARDPSLGTGWIGRHLYSIDPADPNALLRAVGISTGLPRQLEGGPLTLPVPSLTSFGITGSSSTTAARRAVINDMYSGTPDPLHAAAMTTLDTIDLLVSINFANYVPAPGAVYPAGSFGTAMRSAAALIKAQVGVEAIAIDISGWDTHTNQGPLTGDMFTLMNTLAQGMSAFYTDMTALPAPTFTMVAMSEFGRRPTENGSLGSDHGHGNALLVVGNCVDGGRVLANWPGMQPNQLFEGQDLAVTIDHRDILAEIIGQRLGNPDLAYVFPQFTPTPRGVYSC